MAGPGGTITLTNGNDVFPRFGVDDNSGNETIYGLDGNDGIAGGLGDDLIYGGAGNDTISGGEGNDLLNGGAGFDTVEYFNNSQGVTIDLTIELQASNGTLGADRLISIEGVGGTWVDDTIIGNNSTNVIFGSSGSDTLRGGGGDDQIRDFATNSETIQIDGGDGNDLVSIVSDNSITGAATGGLGTDILQADPYANDFHLERINVSGFEIFETTNYGLYAAATQLESFDIIRANAAFQALAPIVLAARGSPQTLDLSDELNLGGPRSAWLIGSTDSETITTGDGHDTIRGGAGTDTLHGGVGNDVLRGDAGRDILDGGIGTDTADYAGATSGINIDLRIARQTATGGLGTDDFISIEGVIGGAFDDVITGNDFANSIDGGAGSDTISGGGGSDRIFDVTSLFLGDTLTNIDGGAGDDIVSGDFEQSTTGVLIGGIGLDILRLPAGHGTSYLGQVTISGFEILEASDYGTHLTAAQIESFDIVRSTSSNPAVLPHLYLAASGSAQVVDLVDELNAGGPHGIWLVGSADRETITTGGGNDRIEGGFGNDVLDGGAGNDTLYGETGNDTLRGGLGDDYIVDFSDTSTAIDGGDGNDTALLGGTITSGTVNGGAGFDTLESEGSLNLAQLSITQFEILSFGFSSGIVTARAAQFESFDIIRPNALNPNGSVGLAIAAVGGAQTADLAEELNSGGGPRGVTLFASSDSETITTGDGANAIYAARGNDIVVCGSGDDYAVGEEGNDTLSGGLGNDRLDGSLDNDIVDGGAGNDTLYGGDGDDTVSGGIGDDTLDGEGGTDTLNGGDGNDYIADSGGTTGYIDGGAGDDFVSLANIGAFGYVRAGVLAGGSGVDTLRDADQLQGFSISGFEILSASNVSGTAAQFDSFETIYVGSSLPTYYVSLTVVAIGAAQSLDLTDELATRGGPRGVVLTGSSDDETLTGGAERDVIDGSGGDDTLDGGLGMDDLRGDVGNDLLIGGGDSDFLEGEAGDDVLRGGIAGDSLRGGDGTDRADYTDATGAVIIDLQITGQVLSGGVGGDELISIEDVVGGAYNDTLTGNGGANVLAGNGGNDVLDGQGGSDTADYQGATGGVRVDLAIAGNQNVGGGHGIDRLISIENLAGSAFGDVLYGDAGANTLGGRAGADRLDGMAGNDTIDGGDDADSWLGGGAGVDRINGGLGNDRIDGGGEADVLLGDAGSDFITGGLGNDTVNGGEGDDGNGQGGLFGDGGDDIVSGGNGIDRLSGGDGNDRLTGGAGGDVLTGGAGLDKFAFVTPTVGNDRIDDWTAVDDQIEIDASNFSGGLAAGALAANRLVVSAAPVANQAFGQFLYNTATGQLAWDGDGTGVGAAVNLARLLNGGVPVATLAVGDFDIVA